MTNEPGGIHSNIKIDSTPASSKFDASPHKPTKPVLSRFATTLYDYKIPHATHGLLDAITVSIGCIKTGFDLAFCSAGSSIARAAMSDWLLTPEGIMIAVVGIIPLAILGSIGGYYGTSKEEVAKIIYRRYQAIRDSVKGFISTIKGLKNTITLSKLLWSIDLKYALLPVGLVLGILTIANRMWNRAMVNLRKDMQDSNKNATKAIFNWGSLELLDALPQAKENDTKALKAHAGQFIIVEQRDCPTYTVQKSKSYHLYYVNYDGACVMIPPSEIDAYEFEALIDTYIKQKNITTSEQSKTKKIIRPSLLEWHTVLKKNIAINHFQDYIEQVKQIVDRNRQSESQKNRANFSALTGAVFDGLYMFMGLVALSALSPYSLVLVSSVSILFCVLCLLSRAHEEKEYQRNLDVTRQKAELAIASKQVEIELAILNALVIQEANIASNDYIARLYHLDISNLNEDLLMVAAIARIRNSLTDKLQLERSAADKKVNDALSQFKSIQHKLHQTLDITHWDSFMVGIRHGVSAYIALLALVYAASTISLVFFSIAMPEVVALCTIAVGLVVTAGFVGHSFNCAKAYKQHHRETSPQAMDMSINQFITSKKNISKGDLFKDYPEIEAKDDIEDANPNDLYSKVSRHLGMPSWHIMATLDVFRSICSGFGKGPRLGDFVTGHSDSNTDSTDHGDPLSIIFYLVLALLFSVVYLFRQLAKYHKELDDPHPIYHGQSKASQLNQTNDHDPHSLNAVPTTSPETPLNPDELDSDQADNNEEKGYKTGVDRKKRAFSADSKLPNKFSKQRTSPMTAHIFGKVMPNPPNQLRAASHNCLSMFGTSNDSVDSPKTRQSPIDFNPPIVVGGPPKDFEKYLEVIDAHELELNQRQARIIYNSRLVELGTLSEDTTVTPGSPAPEEHIVVDLK